MFLLDSVFEVCDHPVRGPGQFHPWKQATSVHPSLHCTLATVLHVVAHLPPGGQIDTHLLHTGRTMYERFWNDNYMRYDNTRRKWEGVFKHLLSYIVNVNMCEWNHSSFENVYKCRHISVGDYRYNSACLCHIPACWKH